MPYLKRCSCEHLAARPTPTLQPRHVHQRSMLSMARSAHGCKPSPFLSFDGLLDVCPRYPKPSLTNLRHRLTACSEDKPVCRSSSEGHPVTVGRQSRASRQRMVLATRQQRTAKLQPAKMPHQLRISAEHRLLGHPQTMTLWPARLLPQKPRQRSQCPSNPSAQSGALPGRRTRQAVPMRWGSASRRNARCAAGHFC